jgi:hypothetical protein
LSRSTAFSSRRPDRYIIRAREKKRKYGSKDGNKGVILSRLPHLSLEMVSPAASALPAQGNTSRSWHVFCKRMQGNSCAYPPFVARKYLLYLSIDMNIFSVIESFVQTIAQPVA